MILTKLKEYAEERMSLPPTMYGENKIAWYIDITTNGKFEGFIRLKSKEAKRGKAVITPHIGRSSGVKPKLLADTAEYVLGVGREKSKPKRVQECHEQFKALIQECAKETGEPELQAIAQFLGSSEIKQAKQELPEGFDPSDVLTFRVAGKIPANAGENWNKIEKFWAKYTSGGTEDNSSKKNPAMTCLITGNVTEVEQRLPFKIKGIIGGQAYGTALVSANSKAFESYGLKNSLTSPISKDAAEKFANALNSLIANEQGKSRIYLGSTVYVFWTREKTSFNPLSCLDKPDPDAVGNLLKSPLTAKQASSLKTNQFYGLSLTANNARTVVRDWLETTVPNVEANLKAWFQRQQIVDAFGAKYRPLPVYVLAASIYRDAAKEMQPRVPTALMRNALKGDRLSYDLLNKLVRRNRVERNVTYPRAMLTKLIFSSDLSTQTMMTDMEQLNLNPNLEEGDRSAYYCGRLLAVLEAIQRKAIGSVNASLTDRYYGAASSTPANAFSPLMRGARNNLATLRHKNRGACMALEQKIEEVTFNLPTFPKTLNLQQQGLFALGYYHQRASDRAAAKANSPKK
ncbi:MAG: type I-C CRISPR-associated protein Cas8c/Csd1 [Cyanobacteria bacterium J06600_6]